MAYGDDEAAAQLLDADPAGLKHDSPRDGGGAEQCAGPPSGEASTRCIYRAKVADWLSVVSGELVLRAGLSGAVVAALALSGCAKDPYVSSAGALSHGDWRIERQLDRITGAPVSNAFVISHKVSSSMVDFPRPVSLSIHCFKGEPIVRLAFPFKVGATRTAVLGYQFDDRKGREVDAKFLHDYRTIVIEDRAAVAQFVDDLADSTGLYVRIRSLNAGRND